MTVAIAILNWNGKEHLETYLPSVVEHSSQHSIYIIDNGSTDDSIDFVQSVYPSINIIQLDQNHGFCGGYNKGLSQISAEYYILLNSDIEVSPNWVENQLTELQKDTNIVACQPKIKAYKDKEKFEHAGASGGYIDVLGYPFCRGRILMNEEQDHGQYDTTKDIFWATGAALLIKAEIFHSLGGLDETFFAHMEEIDLCWRIKNAGYRIICVPQSVVYHLGGATLSYDNPRKTYLNFRNGLAILLKNLPGSYVIPILFARLLLDGVAGVQFLVLGYFRHTWAIVRAHFAFYSRIPYYLKLRKRYVKNVKTHHHVEMFKRSIVFNYFILKRKTFHSLNFLNR